jgi:hypothetical protein
MPDLRAVNTIPMVGASPNWNRAAGLTNSRPLSKRRLPALAAIPRVGPS